MNDPLRICLVSAAYWPYPSGVSEHVHDLALALHALGQKVQVLTTNYPNQESDPVPFPVTRIGRVAMVPMNRSFATLPVGLRLQGQVRRFMKAGRFDIVHCHGLFWPEISYWAIRYSRAVSLFTILNAGFRLSSAGSGLYRWLFRRHLSRIRGRIAISRRARAFIEPYVPGEYRNIPCGVDLDRFRPGLEPLPKRESARPTFLFLGRLDHRKGLSVLLRALPLVRREIPSTRLVVVGSGPEEQRNRDLAARLGIANAVEFRGRAPFADLPRYYAGCDVFCSPALGGETFGIVLIEAMAVGAPVVASDIPGYDETVCDGTDGLLCPAGNEEALARALTRVLSDPVLRERLAAGGLARARAHAWPLIARQTLDYYRELLSREPLRTV